MKTIFGLILGLTLFLSVSIVEADVVITPRRVATRYYYPVPVQNSVYRTYFAAPHGYYHDNLGRLVPTGFRYNVYGHIVRNRITVVEPTVTFGVWNYTPDWRTDNPWWR